MFQILHYLKKLDTQDRINMFSEVNEVFKKIKVDIDTPLGKGFKVYSMNSISIQFKHLPTKHAHILCKR